MRTNQMSIFLLVNTITHLNGTNLRVQVRGPMRSMPNSRFNLSLLISIDTVNVPQFTKIISYYPKIRTVSTLDFHRKEVIVPPKVLSVKEGTKSLHFYPSEDFHRQLTR